MARCRKGYCRRFTGRIDGKDERDKIRPDPIVTSLSRVGGGGYGSPLLDAVRESNRIQNESNVHLKAIREKIKDTPTTGATILGSENDRLKPRDGGKISTLPVTGNRWQSVAIGGNRGTKQPPPGAIGYLLVTGSKA